MNYLTHSGRAEQIQETTVPTKKIDFFEKILNVALNLN
jgi:hypothetical protein